MEVIAYFLWQKSGVWASQEWHDPACMLRA